jgi:hypothetical protein
MPKTIAPATVPDTEGLRVTWPKNLTPGLLVEYLASVVTEKTLANWRSSGYGPPFVKVGTSVIYRLPSVDRWLDSMEKLGDVA